jgi:hypothetical protein
MEHGMKVYRGENMKQIKFLKTIALEGKPIWLGGYIYECLGESDTSYGHMYKIISEDMIPRGIYEMSRGKDFEIIEIPDKLENKTEKKIPIISSKKTSKKNKSESYE